MQYEGTTYRPPPEADTPLLQVTVGCAHNRCTFCDMYRDVPFRRIPMDQIHPTNTVRIFGRLPQDKRSMMAAIDEGIKNFGRKTLATAFARTSL